MGEAEEVQEKMKAENGGHKRANGHNDEGHDEHEEDGRQRFGKYGWPHDVQIQNEHAFPSYGLPPNYTPPNVAYTLNENLNNSTPILIENQ